MFYIKIPRNDDSRNYINTTMVKNYGYIYNNVYIAIVLHHCYNDASCMYVELACRYVFSISSFMSMNCFCES